MAGQSNLPSLEASLEYAKAVYRANAKVAGERGQTMSMTLDEWQTQARERHKVLSNLDADSQAVAIEEDRRESIPALLAARDILDGFLEAYKHGTQKKYAAGIVKRAHEASRQAKQKAKEQR